MVKTTFDFLERAAAVYHVVAPQPVGAILKGKPLLGRSDDPRCSHLRKPLLEQLERKRFAIRARAFPVLPAAVPVADPVDRATEIDPAHAAFVHWRSSTSGRSLSR